MEVHQDTKDQGLDNPSWLSDVRSAPTLATFANLKRLVVPQDLLIERGQTLDHAKLEPTSNVLPPNLEHLGIIYPSDSLLGWLATIAEDQKAHFPNLRILELWATDGFGDDFLQLWEDKTRQLRHTVWADL
ncbi:hypothetical protein CC80DRAFT_496181, partial [Byssothecium circinans]